jgi:hypothetical protein
MAFIEQIAKYAGAAALIGTVVGVGTTEEGRQSASDAFKRVSAATDMRSRPPQPGDNWADARTRERQAQHRYIAENQAIVAGWMVTVMESHANPTAACNDLLQEPPRVGQLRATLSSFNAPNFDSDSGQSAYCS